MASLFKFRGLFTKNKYYSILFLTIIFSLFFLVSAPFFQSVFNNLMSIATYLAWHIILEFFGVIAAICVFFVSYFSYDQTKNFRYLFLGSILLLVGFIDFFHAMSFKGMPEFFISNATANRATTFWIVGRVIISLGFLLTCIIPVNVEIPRIKIISFIIPFIISVWILIIITYFRDLLPPMYVEGQGLTPTKIYLEYLVIALNLVAVFLFILEYKKSDDNFNIILVIALTIGIFSEICFTFYNSVYDIYNYFGHLYKFVMYYLIFRVMFINNIRKPYMELKKAKNEIKDYADNLDRIVEKRTDQIKLINRKLMEDLEYARDIQMSMLPKELPNVPGAAFEACYFPAERVSGDFYNIFKISETKIGMYIGDVSGHGVPAAMLTIFMNQRIKTTSETELGFHETLLPSEVLKHVFLAYNKTNFKAEVYSVMLYGVLDLTDRVFTFSSAGLNVPPLIVSNTGEVTEFDIKGFPICKFQTDYAETYMDESIKLNSQDKILFYTDGLIDAADQQKQAFSDIRLKRLLRKSSHLNALELSNNITTNVFSFMQDSKIQDDITFFIMEVK